MSTVSQYTILLSKMSNNTQRNVLSLRAGPPRNSKTVSRRTTQDTDRYEPLLRVLSETANTAADDQ